MSGDREFNDVREFQHKFNLWTNDQKPGHVSSRKMQERIDFIQEELDELKRAAESNDLAEQIDALIDIVWVAKGLGNMLSMQWSLHWAEVREANMAKERGIGPRGNLSDVIKPEGWEGPDHEAILKGRGYKRSAWVDDSGNLICGREDEEHAEIPMVSNR